MSQIKPSKPEWLKVRIPTGEKYLALKKLMRSLNLATVCEEANCPNIGECWQGGTATIMLMGDTCTRGCRFCNVKTGNPKGWLDEKEPEKVAFTVSRLGLKYIVLTSVDRDDLPDEGASHIAKTISYIKKSSPGLLVEILAPDFKGKHACIETVITAKPDVFAHNIETVEPLTRKVRDPRAGYKQSLDVLSWAKRKGEGIYTKSSIMLGLGEDDKDVLQTLKDLRSVDCDIVTFGQYLRPQKRHLPVAKYVSPEKFEEWKRIAKQEGFLYVASGPLVRSSYRAGEFFMESLIKNKKNQDTNVKKLS